MKAKGFDLINEDKVRRAKEGSPNSSGVFVGGVAKPDGSYGEDALLAEYDKLGGLIKRGGDKVKTGSFYDFKARRPKAEAEVVFEYRVNGKVVEVPDNVELPGEVKAVKVAKEAPKKLKK